HAGVVLGFLDFFGIGRWLSLWWPDGVSQDDVRIDNLHSHAFATALKEFREHFHQCVRCGNCVCPENCWNELAHLCRACVATIHEELEAYKPLAMVAAAEEQLFVDAGHVDYTSGRDVSTSAISSTASPAALSLN